ncbi:pathogenicity protein [Sesbania bispinosa]|nr:pathogenicity protein [Sesbania bispinosa]
MWQEAIDGASSSFRCGRYCSPRLWLSLGSSSRLWLGLYGSVQHVVEFYVFCLRGFGLLRW